jgi:cytochrome c oxidase subunit 3
MGSQGGVQKHPFHLVDPSPWPFMGALSAWLLTTGGVLYFHGYTSGGNVLSMGLVFLLFTMFVWWRDVIREATYEGHHTERTQAGLRMGMLLFIVSEVMFFFAFFWAFFASSLAPVVELGAVWPPQGIDCFSAWEVPFLNTAILLLSGASATWAHHAVISGARKELIYGLIFTVVLAAVFTACQVFEYSSAGFSINDSVYGSAFYMATGFHGFHVFIGTCCLLVCLFRAMKSHFATTHHVGLEASLWYWHFVDVVWLFLFVAIYWWGGL